MNSTRIAAAALGLTLAMSAPAAAQIVNPLLKGVPESGFGGEIKGSLAAKSGNVEVTLFHMSVLALWRTGDHTFISSSDSELGYKGGTATTDKFLNRHFTHARYQLALGGVLTWELFAQAGLDEFKRLSLRWLLGSGPRFTLFEGDSLSTAIGVAYLSEHEELGKADTPDSGEIRDNHRVSSYLTGRFALDSRIILTTSLYYQPLIMNPFGDSRLSLEAELAVKLTERLSLGLNFSMALDQASPDDVMGRDMSTTFNIGVAL